jgi:crotonobetainyl-CoA:carnitine CoA-transferase CaiB-like acyl-CoA transferase
MKKHPVDGEGTPVRRQGMIRDGLSWYFAAVNRDKRSLCRLRLRRNGVV